VREDSPESSRVCIAYPSDFGMHTETKFSIAVPSSNVVNYHPRGIGIDPTIQNVDAPIYSEPWSSSKCLEQLQREP